MRQEFMSNTAPRTGVIVGQNVSSIQVNGSSSNTSVPTATLQHDQRNRYQRHRNRQNKSTEDNRTATTTTIQEGGEVDRLFPVAVGFDNRMSSSNRSLSCQQRKPPTAKSPFARSQSRVFYESHDVWHSKDDAERGTMSLKQEKQPPSSFVVDQVDESGQFRRSIHRSNTSYKSEDSGFSDAAETSVLIGNAIPDSNVTKTTTTTTDDRQIRIPKSPSSNSAHSPAKRLAKWSSSAKHPLKMFWKQQDGSKVSMLKCCAGMSPFFSFYHNRQIKPPSDGDLGRNRTGTDDRVHVACSPSTVSGSRLGERVSRSDDCGATPVSESNGDHTGTWPRTRKMATSREDAEKLPSESSSAAKNVYYSTRLKRNQKPRNLSKNNLGPSFQEEESQEPKNNFRNTLFVCNSAVQLWLRDMHWSTEDECMNTLQSKAVARDLADVSVIAIRNAKDAIVLLRRLGYGKTTELKQLKRSIDAGQLKSALVDCDSLSFSARCLLRDTRSFQFKEVPAVQRHLRLVFAHCSILKQLMDRLHRAELTADNAPSPLDVHFALEMAFENLFDALVLCHLKTVVDILEEPPSIRSLKTAVTCIGSLGTLDSNLCHLIAKTESIRSLLTVCIEPRYISIRALVLRSLATLCCSEGSIQDLEESGGVDCITDILSENNASVTEKCEAAGVIAQITSPLLDNGANVSGLAENIPSLIRSLTDVARFTNSHDGFLLSTAAIGNLTFLASRACRHLVECKTVSVLVSACLRKDRTTNEKIAESVFIKDQVATILANMAGVSEGRNDIIRSGGLVLLLSLLQVRPSAVDSAVEVAACERVQQKSAIALSRLCSDAKIAQEVVTLRGIQRLVTLCKDERERNYSDAVLVACLAVLRKIATSCGVNEFKELNATELVEPRLLDSFLIYSSRQESYV